MNFNVNSVLAAMRREEREEQKRQRELERRAKDQAKLSALEQARLEVETYENRLEVLLSVHKQQGESWYWPALTASLSPLPPQRNSHHEFRLRQQLEVWGGKLLLGIGHFPLAGSPQQGKTAAIERAWLARLASGFVRRESKISCKRQNGVVVCARTESSHGKADQRYPCY